MQPMRKSFPIVAFCQREKKYEAQKHVLGCVGYRQKKWENEWLKLVYGYTEEWPKGKEPKWSMSAAKLDQSSAEFRRTIKDGKWVEEINKLKVCDDDGKDLLKHLKERAVSYCSSPSNSDEDNCDDTRSWFSKCNPLTCLKCKKGSCKNHCKNLIHDGNCNNCQGDIPDIRTCRKCENVDKYDPEWRNKDGHTNHRFENLGNLNNGDYTCKEIQAKLI